MSRRAPRKEGNPRAQTNTHGPFGQWAMQLHGLGLTPLPVGATEGQPEGKVPLIKNWAKPKSSKTIADLAERSRFAGANIGIACGPSRITVIDIDHPDDIQAALEKFGPTPLAWHTPKGGAHLVYRSAGERNGCLAPLGLRGDVRGIGGLVVVPPSVRLAGPFEGRRYEFFSDSSWIALRHIPPIRAGVFDAPSAPVVARQESRKASAMTRETSRNCYLHSNLLKQAGEVDSYEELLAIALRENQDFSEPLKFPEVEKTARSAWGYEQRGENWCGREGMFAISNSDLSIFEGNGNAMLLLAHLMASHALRDEFAICAAAMAAANIIPGWSEREYRRQAKWLCSRGFLVQTHQGGKRRGDASRFVLAKGAGNAVNRNNTPLSADSAPRLEREAG